MCTHIKPLNALKTKFSINGKLAVIKYSSADKKSKNIEYSMGLTEQEDVDFKKYLDDYKII